MTPTHSDGLAAAKRICAAIEGGAKFASAADAITMHLYYLSLELRRWPITERAAKARECARLIVRNTGESLG